MQWAQSYPADDVPANNLGFDYSLAGQLDKALAQTLETLRLTPNSVIAYGNLMGNYMSLNRPDEAKAAYDNALQLKLDGPGLRLSRYQLAFYQNDEHAMQEIVAWFQDKPAAIDQMLTAQSDTEAYHGRLSKARSFSQQAVDAALHSGAKESAAIWQANAAQREAEFGNVAAAHTAASQALGLSADRDTRILVALALARAGDRVQAQKMADQLSAEAPLDTLIQGYWLPAIRGAIELDNGNGQKAIDALQPALAYDLGAPPPVQLGVLYPAYVRGVAYLKTKQAAQAQAEFQKIVAHRGLTINFPLGSLAHLQLARAYAIAGDSAKARTSYQDFFGLWKDADPDVPVLKEARAEYEKVK